MSVNVNVNEIFLSCDAAWLSVTKGGEKVDGGASMSGEISVNFRPAGSSAGDNTASRDRVSQQSHASLHLDSMRRDDQQSGIANCVREKRREEKRRRVWWGGGLKCQKPLKMDFFFSPGGKQRFLTTMNARKPLQIASFFFSFFFSCKPFFC